MDPGGIGSRLLTEGLVITALVTVGLMILMAFGYLADVVGPGPRRVATLVLLLVITLAILATTAHLFPQEVSGVYDFLNRLGYR